MNYYLSEFGYIEVFTAGDLRCARFNHDERLAGYGESDVAAIAELAGHLGRENDVLKNMINKLPVYEDTGQPFIPGRDPAFAVVPVQKEGGSIKWDAWPVACLWQAEGFWGSFGKIIDWYSTLEAAKAVAAAKEQQ
jgi:hypothetical protein